VRERVGRERPDERERTLKLRDATGSEQPGAEPSPLSFASAWRRARLTVEERVARGRSARGQAPRSSHRRFESATDRPDPISLLEEQAESRVKELVPIRYGRMLVSPLTFYRGAAAIMAADLAQTPRSGVTVQLCGDAHLSNFGLFGTPERRMLFDINDFDETLPGPWEWDLKRLAASFEVHGRDRGFTRTDRRAIVLAGVSEYRKRMRRAAKQRTLDSWYDHLEAGQLIDRVRQEVREGSRSPSEAHAAEGLIAKARTRDSVRVFTKASRSGRRRAADPAGPAARRSPRGHSRSYPGVGRARGSDQEVALVIPAHARPRAPSPRGIPLRPRCGQVSGSRKRRKPLLRGAYGRSGSERPVVPAGEGGLSLSPGAMPGHE
jgi:hypothetical protein